MINPDAELNRLRSYLGQRNWLPSEVDEICDLAANDVNEVILDIISNAVAETSDYAIELGAEEFLEDMDVIEIGGGYMIGTISGKTDFSIPKKEMLPHLLKNAKVSEDGNRYKVIPVGGEKTETRPRDIFSHMQRQQDILHEARKSINQQGLDNRSARAQKLADQWKTLIARNRQVAVDSIKSKRAVSATQKPEFRTASEKQDASTQWVIPAKEMDMTGYLMDINKRIQENIYSSVTSIIEGYEKEFA